MVHRFESDNNEGKPDSRIVSKGCAVELTLLANCASKACDIMMLC